MRSPIKWVGAKGRASTLTRLLSLVPDEIDYYYEPFFGSGALFFALAARQQVKSALLADLNPHLVAMWQGIKSEPHHVLHWLKFYESLDGEEIFHGVRKKFNVGPEAFPEPGAFAAAFIYLNRAGYNGLYRVNAKGEFNGPYSEKRKIGQIVFEEAIFGTSNLLREVDTALMHLDFMRTIELAGAGDFIYCDPPYAGTFSDYACPRFGLEDHERLRDALTLADARGARFMVSNSAVDEVFHMYDGFNFYESERSNAVNANGADRSSKPDLLITNYVST